MLPTSCLWHCPAGIMIWGIVPPRPLNSPISEGSGRFPERAFISSLLYFCTLSSQRRPANALHSTGNKGGLRLPPTFPCCILVSSQFQEKNVIQGLGPDYKAVLSVSVSLRSKVSGMCLKG
ncbi:hypothetical protein FKM82_026014 [Ascaphus truei]